MTPNQIKFLKEEAKTAKGQEWLKFMAEQANEFYNCRGIKVEEIAVRQKVAEHLEKIINLSEDSVSKKPIGTEYE